MSPKTVAMAGSVLLHGLAAAALLSATSQPTSPAPPGARALQVRLLSPAGAATIGSAGGAGRPAAPAPGAALPYYYFPHEVERELIPLRDRSGEAEIELDGPVVVHLFVDDQGRIADMQFESGASSPLLQARLRAAFAATEFLPAQKGGRAVPARIRIELVQQPSGA